MKNKKIFFIVSLLFIFSIVFVFNFVKAENLADALSKVSNVSEKTGIEQTDIKIVLASVIKVLISVSGLIFLTLTVYAGILWMTARGDEGKIEKAKDTIIASVIGLVVITSSYAITNIIQDRIIEGNKSQGGSLSTENNSEIEKTGCCIDWVSGTNFANGNWLELTNKTSRLTTYSDCKEWGEKEGNGDVWYCDGPKKGCWIFIEGVTDLDTCKEIRQNY